MGHHSSSSPALLLPEQQRKQRRQSQEEAPLMVRPSHCRAIVACSCASAARLGCLGWRWRWWYHAGAESRIGLHRTHVHHITTCCCIMRHSVKNRPPRSPSLPCNMRCCHIHIPYGHLPRPSLGVLLRHRSSVPYKGFYEKKRFIERNVLRLTSEENTVRAYACLPYHVKINSDVVGPPIA